MKKISAFYLDKRFSPKKNMKDSSFSTKSPSIYGTGNSLLLSNTYLVTIMKIFMNTKYKTLDT